MAAPTTEFGSDGAGTITATGEDNGLLQPINARIANPRLKVGVSGTFTTVVLAVRGSLRGVSGGDTYYPLTGRDLTTGRNLANSASISLTNSTNACYEFDVDGFDNVEVYAVSGTPTDLDVEARVEPSAPGRVPLVLSTSTSASTFSGAVSLPDSVQLKFGTSDDVTAAWDGTDFDILPAADDSVLNIGDGTTSFDVKIFGNAATSFALWDASADQFILNQGATDTVLFSLRSSDVATGATTIVKGGTVTTNDYFTIGKHAAATGGAALQAVAESTVAVGMHIEAWCGAPATTDTSSSLGAMNFFVGQHNGSNADADMAADSNAFAWGEIDASNAYQTRMLLKADDGELHLGNATPAALDTEDDIMLVRTLQKESSRGRGIVETVYDNANRFATYERLHELGICGPKDETGFHLFALQPRIALHEGAMWQIYNDVLEIARALPAESRAALPERLRERLALAGV